MIDSQSISTALSGSVFESCAARWIKQASMVLEERPHGDRPGWMAAVQSLPALTQKTVKLDQDAVQVEAANVGPEQIIDALQALHPWRKGPFSLCGVEIDSEWRSDWKWRRIADQISPLSGRRVLDVGCGNGYYLFRMLGAGASLAVGIDPTQLFLAQFAAVNHFVGSDRAFILPLRSDELTVDEVAETDRFDTVFSMGVYYHRKQPTDHLRELHGFLRPGGELVLETLVIADPGDAELVPTSRYAQMRNVWSLPSVPRLLNLLEQCGFESPRLIDLTATSVQEQRATDWMRFDSLARFLDPSDHTKTIEGYPAPLRAGITAVRAC